MSNRRASYRVEVARVDYIYKEDGDKSRSQVSPTIE